MGLNFRLFIVLCLLGLSSAAQDTLPRFSIVNRGKERIIISWTNPYGAQIKQVSIQRSFDSLKNFKTILTVPDPTVPQNGYVDAKATNDHMYYRLYILLDSGRYSFSRSKRPVTDNSVAVVTQPTGTTSRGVIPIDSLSKQAEKIERIIYVKKHDTLIGGIPESNLKRFRDSINFTTKDTIYMKSPDTAVVRVFIPKELYRPSRFVFTEKDGNIRIALPDAGRHKYTIKFFEEDLSEAFEVKQISETVLFLDKSNFHHSGWFSFELYEDGKLKERHKLFVPKDF
jgi:hypothetical protein